MMMNAARVRPLTVISSPCAKPDTSDHRIFAGNFGWESVMASSHMNASLSRALRMAFACFAISGSTALASQGPGGGAGRASHFTQTTMAVLVYGVPAVVVCVGLIGAVR